MTLPLPLPIVALKQAATSTFSQFSYHMAITLAIIMVHLVGRGSHHS